MDKTTLESHRAALLAAACDVRARAYAPYSNYAVGAAILMDDGRIYTGVNVENASYGGAICAERTALGKAVTDGARRIAAIAVCTSNGVAPCGICRQSLVEFASPEADPPVWLVDTAGQVRETSVFGLMPDSFGAKDLPA